MTPGELFAESDGVLHLPLSPSTWEKVTYKTVEIGVKILEITFRFGHSDILWQLRCFQALPTTHHCSED